MTGKCKINITEELVKLAFPTIYVCETGNQISGYGSIHSLGCKIRVAWLNHMQQPA